MPNVFDPNFRQRLFEEMWGFRDPFEYIPYGTNPPTNTFRRTAMPREGYIDARRDDGCVPCITTLK